MGGPRPKLETVASKTVTLSAARKLVEARNVRWPDGPLCRSNELKVWDIDLADFLPLVAEVERAARTSLPTAPQSEVTRVAAQWLRRMFYSTPLAAAGGKFDAAIAPDPSAVANAARRTFPLTTADVPQSVLDALARIRAVRIPGATPPYDVVEISHVFVLMDLRLNGRTVFAQGFDIGAGVTGPEIDDIFSWAGDLGSAIVAFNDQLQPAKRAAGASWAEPMATPADLATPLGWLETGIAGRAPLDDLLGDMDAVVLSDRSLPATPTPIASQLRQYYTVGVPSTSIARVDDRFPQFVTRLVPPMPLVTGGATISLDPLAEQWLRNMIFWAAFTLLQVSRAQAAAGTVGSMSRDFPRSLAEAPNAVGTAANANPKTIADELGSPWTSAMIDELADRFTAFLAAGLAGGSPGWRGGGTPSTVSYPGYDWIPAPPVIAGVPEVNDLEAIGQFYANWRQPHQNLGTARTLKPLRLRDPAGSTATLTAGAGTAIVTVDDFVDLREVTPSATGDHADLLYLDRDTARASKTYRIVAVDPGAQKITVDGIPALPAASAWTVIRRPWLVIVDPFGGRIGGVAASSLGLPSGWLSLDGAPDFNRMRANLDMVRLNTDTSRNSRMYRLVAVHPTEPRIQLDGPVLPTITGWQLPAGLAWEINPLATTLIPTPAGCDSYDGLLFVVYRNTLQGQPVPCTSYSSTENAADPVLGSSIVGNRRFAARSLRSPTSDARNYEFAVADRDKVAADAVAAAAYYQDGVTAMRQPAPSTPTVRKDPDGKVNIRIHIGNTTGSVVGSTGDVVAVGYPALRAQLIAVHQAERASLGLPADPDLAAVAAATTQPASVNLYNSGTVGDTAWNGRLQCSLVLVRPEQRPTAP